MIEFFSQMLKFLLFFSLTKISLSESNVSSEKQLTKERL